MGLLVATTPTVRIGGGERDAMESFSPLTSALCVWCLEQRPAYVAGEEICARYTPLMPCADRWVMPACVYVAMQVARPGLGPQSRASEVGSNGGYLF